MEAPLLLFSDVYTTTRLTSRDTDIHARPLIRERRASTRKRHRAIRAPARPYAPTPLRVPCHRSAHSSAASPRSAASTRAKSPSSPSTRSNSTSRYSHDASDLYPETSRRRLESPGPISRARARVYHSLGLHASMACIYSRLIRSRDNCTCILSCASLRCTSRA